MDIQNPEKIEIEGLKTIHKLCKFGADHNMEGCSFTEIVERMFDELSKTQAVPEWIPTSERMPNEGEEVFVHSFGQVRQVTRDSSWAGGFKERNCYGWQAAYSQSHWMPKSIKLPEDYNFYYENDAKQKAMIEAQEQSHD